MHYDFPEIVNLDQVLEAISGVEGFIVAPRDWGTVVNYVNMGSDMFPEVRTAGGSASMREKQTRLKAIRRECRGLICCKKTGLITRRPLHKFWNVNERDETQLDKLDFSVPHRVYTKLDGSMLVPFEIEHGSGMVRWGTKMGAGTEVALAAEVFVAKNPKYQLFAEWCIQQGVSPIFEFTTPGKHKIVVDYDAPMLTLLAARHMITGEYLDLLQDAAEYSIPSVQAHDPISNPQSFMKTIKELEGSEGVIIAWANGHRAKVKGDWYITRHKAKDKILRENGLIELILDEAVDDVKPVLSADDRHSLEEFENEFWTGVNDTAGRWQLTHAHVKGVFGNNRKGFALDPATDEYDPNLRAAIFKNWDVDWRSVDWRGLVANVIRKNLGSGPKVDAVRHLFGNAHWRYGETTEDV